VVRGLLRWGRARRRHYVRGPTPEESEAARSHFHEFGAEVLIEGRIGESIHFYYLDTEPNLKVFESGTGHAVDLKPAGIYPARSQQGSLTPQVRSWEAPAKVD
jgi:hypothetical protein